MWDLQRFSKSTAIICEDGTELTYGELDTLQRRCVLFVHQERRLVFLIADNSLDSIILYISCIQNKIPIMLLEHSIRSSEIKGIIKAYHPSYIWAPNDYETIHNYLDYGVFRGYKLMISEENEKAATINPKLALLLLTSGSTGSKKCVRISYKNIEVNQNSIVKALEITQQDRAMIMLPICYSYGLSVVNSNLSVGATLLLPKTKLFGKEFWNFFDRNNGTSICGVPYTYEVLLKTGFISMKLKHLRLITQAGGKLEEKWQRQLLQYSQTNQVDIALMYGQTEATARMSTFFLNRFPEKINSVGKTIEGGEFRIEKPDQSGIGEVIYLGENVSMGYADEISDLSMEDENGQKLYTGDMGYLDAEGFLYLIGRKKRIAKIHGYRINLMELEQLLEKKSGVNVICIENMEKIIVCILKQSDYESVLSACNLLNIDSRLLNIRVVKQIPRNSAGKVLYETLRKEICVTNCY